MKPGEGDRRGGFFVVRLGVVVLRGCLRSRDGWHAQNKIRWRRSFHS